MKTLVGLTLLALVPLAAAASFNGANEVTGPVTPTPI